MSFEWPQLLWLLFIPVFLLAWEITHRRRVAVTNRPKILRAEAGVRSLKLSSFESKANTPRSRPRWWLYVGIALAIAALSRPQWGRIDEPVFDQSREILLAVDLSRSMLAKDVRPSRLDRSKLLIQSLLEKLAGERVGLVVFAGTAFLQSPLSADYEILREFLPALGPEFLPEGGTNYRALIDTSLSAFAGGPTADRFLIILSDGEATDEDWRSRVDELKTKGIRVIGLGVGTAAGGMIPDAAGGLVKDERGAVVLTKLEPATLQELARATNGVYRDASTWVDLAALLKETVEAGQKGKFVEKNSVRLVERFQWPLAFGFWCLLVSFCYEFPVRPRVRDMKMMPADKTPKAEGGARKAEKPIAATVASLLFILWAIAGSPSAGLSAVVTAPSKDDPNPKEPPPGATLAKIVGRISTAPNQSARDWAEFGRETVTWGSHLESAGQEIPAGPVNDALSAVGLGAKLDPKTTDWPKLREDLEALLKKHDEAPPSSDEKKKDNQQQDKEKDQDQSPDKSQANDGKKSQEDQKEPPEGQNKTPPDQKPQGESAFGEMKQKNDTPPTPPSQDTQKVGGAQEKQGDSNEPQDPALAQPLQKLDQLRNQDSPALLFQLMEGDKKPVKKSGKDW